MPSDEARRLAAEMFAVFVHPAPTAAMLDAREKQLARAVELAQLALDAAAAAARAELGE